MNNKESKVNATDYDLRACEDVEIMQDIADNICPGCGYKLEDNYLGQEGIAIHFKNCYNCCSLYEISSVCIYEFLKINGEER